MTDLRKLDLRRRRIGMSRAVLARRAGLSLPTVQRILSGKETAPSVATVEALAAALGMQFRLEETTDVEELREQQATKKARRLAGMVQATMGLESQAIEVDALERLTKQHIHKFLAGSSRKLWED